MKKTYIREKILYNFKKKYIYIYIYRERERERERGGCHCLSSSTTTLENFKCGMSLSSKF